MKLTSLLSIVVLLVFWRQNAESKEITYPFEFSLENISPNELTKYNYDQRSIKDIWNSIKNSAIKAWDFVKNLAQNTKQQINNLIQNVKNQANVVIKTFEEHINNLKQKLNDIIIDIFGNDEITKQCLEDGKKGLDNAFKEILKHMTTCVVNELKKLALLNDRQSQLPMNDTQFNNELEKKLDICAKDPENAEECCFNVRKNVFDETEDMEDFVLDSRIESKNMADDILNTISKCFIDSLIAATSLVTKEVLDVSKCVLKAKIQNETSNFAN